MYDWIDELTQECGRIHPPSGASRKDGQGGKSYHHHISWQPVRHREVQQRDRSPDSKEKVKGQRDMLIGRAMNTDVQNDIF